jgi:hypothetical protein
VPLALVEDQAGITCAKPVFYSLPGRRSAQEWTDLWARHHLSPRRLLYYFAEDDRWGNLGTSCSFPLVAFGGWLQSRARRPTCLSCRQRLCTGATRMWALYRSQVHVSETVLRAQSSHRPIEFSKRAVVSFNSSLPRQRFEVLIGNIWFCDMWL